MTEFRRCFEQMTGHAPFPWQERLYVMLMEGAIPERCDIPTGLGKTSVIPIWLLALLAGAPVPRRLAYVVNRRTIVDQSTEVVTRMVKELEQAEMNTQSPLRTLACAMRKRDRLGAGVLLGVSTLRGEMADNQQWLANPAAPSIIVGTVDMIGSKLLFQGYGDSRRKRPLHAAFLGCDTLVVHDEAHLTPAFGRLLFGIREQQRLCETPIGVPGLAVMELSATHSDRGGAVLDLSPEDLDSSLVRQRLHAAKVARFHEVDKAGTEVRDKLLELALRTESERCERPARVLVFVQKPDDAARIVEDLKQELRRRSEERWSEEHPDDKVSGKQKTGIREEVENRVALLTGRLRGHERDGLLAHPVMRVLTGPEEPAKTVFLVATSAGEVGIDLDADYMVCDLTTLDSMIQRLGRLNRFGSFDRADVHIVSLRDVIAPRGKRKKALDEADETFGENDAKERSKREKSVLGQEKKVRAAELRVSTQEEKATTAKTDKSRGTAKARLAVEQEKLADERRELAARKADLAEHDSSRERRLADHRQRANEEFVRANAGAWALCKTRDILEQNRSDLSPEALRKVLANPSSREAFPEEAETYPLTSLLLDLWAQTSVHHNPARPEAESWLHGKRVELPETRVCWREELNLFSDIAEQDAAKWFDLLPPQSQETLRCPSHTIKNLDKDKRLSLFVPILQRMTENEASSDAPVVILDRSGKLERTCLSKLVAGDIGSELDYATVVLPTAVGGLDGHGSFSASSKIPVGDVACGLSRVQVRRTDEAWSWRLLEEHEWRSLPSCAHLSQAVRSIAVSGAMPEVCRCLFRAQTRFISEFHEDEAEQEEWLVLFRSMAQARGIPATDSWTTVTEHETDVCTVAETLCRALDFPEPIARAVLFAARYHDEGKRAGVWQAAAGHDNPAEPLAKGNVNWRRLNGYRHEARILLSAPDHAEFTELAEPDLALHLVCAHHGWARPHFPPEAFPEGIPPEECERLIVETMTRYEHLQRRFGWWNLAFVESILRRADAIVSSRENATLEEEA